MAIKKSFRIVRGDGFDLDFAEFHVGDNEKIHNFKAKLRDRKYQIGDTNITSRVINHWEFMELLPEGFQETSGWRKFSLLEVAWLRIIARLRKFGVPLEEITKIKKYIMQWNKKTKTYPLFEYYFAKAIASTDDPYVIVWSDWVADMASSEEIELAKLFEGSQDMLLISLKSVAKEMDINATKSDTLLGVSDDEEELLSQKRFSKSDEIKAKMKEGKISLIETTKIIENPESIEVFHREMRDNGEYGEITTRYIGGDRKLAEIKKKTRLNKG